MLWTAGRTDWRTDEQTVKDELTEGRTDETGSRTAETGSRTEGQMARPTDGRTDGRTDVRANTETYPMTTRKHIVGW